MTRAREPRRAVLVATILASSMTFIDGSVVNAALPVVRAKLGASLAEAQWVIESYMLFLSALLLVGGALGDQRGRRLVFVVGTVIFGAASVWCGVAPDVTQLILARAVQGVGGALLVPGSLALITANFRETERGRAIGTWAALTSIAAGVGPLIGGWLADRLSWRWIFFVNVPLAAVVIAVALSRVPESRDEADRGPIDWLGAALATTMLFAVVVGLTDAPALGFAAGRVRLTLTIAAAALIAFLIVERRSAHPMVPLSMFRSHTFSGVNLMTLFLYAALGAIMFLLPFSLIQIHRYSIVQAAAAFLPFVVVMATLSRAAGWLSDRFGPRLPLTIGPIVAALGLLLFTRAIEPGSYWSTVFPGVILTSVGMAISVAPLTTAVMTAVSARHAGIASGINNATSRVAALLAVAMVGIVSEGNFVTGLKPVSRMAAALAGLAAVSAVLLVSSPNENTAG